MAKRQKNEYPEDYLNWIDSIYTEAEVLNKTAEFNELMNFINYLDEEMYEFNINTIYHYIDFAYKSEHYHFLALIKNTNNPDLLKYLKQEFQYI